MIRDILKIPVNNAIDKICDSIVKRIKKTDEPEEEIKSDEEQLKEELEKLERLVQEHE